VPPVAKGHGEKRKKACLAQDSALIAGGRENCWTGPAVFSDLKRDWDHLAWHFLLANANKRRRSTVGQRD
jgi:hypothetical protein